MRVVLLLTPQQRQQRRAVTAQRLPQQVAVHGEPARVRLSSPRSRKLREATHDALTSRKRSRHELPQSRETQRDYGNSQGTRIGSDAEGGVGLEV